MSWIICGEDKQGNPFTFEANSVKGSCRTALGALLEAKDQPDTAEVLRSRQSLVRKPGLYTLMWDDGTQPLLAGFWIVFGHHYLEDGPFGPPDKTPPYVEEILEALTEEVWWKNYSVYPQKEQQWQPTIILEWPNDLANRSQIRPPGLPLPDSEFAQEEEDDFGAEFWLERLEEETVKPEVSAQTVNLGQWAHLPVNRSLLLVVKGTMKYSRIRHEGSFQMVPAECFGELEQVSPKQFPDWLNEVVEIESFPPSEAREHFLGTPLVMPDGRVSFPLSGWLTKKLGIWPMFPNEIVPTQLAKRDVGSRALAQFKQAMSISLMVLTAIVGLSLVVKKATTPVLEDAPEPPVIMPQPALSLCSADHEKFMEEFRCQIRAYALNADTDKPFCGDKNSTVSMRQPLTQDFADLQALYCGIRDRQADNWVWGDEGNWYNFGKLAASKACFNVLGYPWQYASQKKYMTEEGLALLYPNPDAFFAGNLQINQLTELVAELDLACDEMKSRMEAQLLGSVVSTYIGTAKPSSDIRVTEAYDLRDLVAANIEKNITGTGKRCFEAGLTESPYRTNHYRDMCNGMRPKELLAWQKLDRSGEAPEEEDICTEIDSPTVPNRDLESCSVLSRYERARFGTEREQDEDSKPDKMWDCHIGLSGKSTVGVTKQRIKWDLSLPLPKKYNLSGAGVRHQLLLDAGLQVLAEKGPEAKDLGSCWNVLSEKMSKYTPVHPLLTSLDDGGWPSPEQQLCGQICAAHFRFKKTNPLVAQNWVTPWQDLDQCMMVKDPTGIAQNPKGRFDRLILPWNYTKEGREDVWVEANLRDSESYMRTFEQVCAFNLIAQDYMPDGFLVGGIAPPVWAGDTKKGSRIAGGSEGAAATAAKALSSYGGARSRTTCGYVAAQCFASLMVNVMGNDSNQLSAWQNEFSNAVTAVARTKPEELAVQNPWCRLVKPYLGQNGVLPEGQLDFPCAKGVSEAQDNAEVALEQLIAEVGAP